MTLKRTVIYLLIVLILGAFSCTPPDPGQTKDPTLAQQEATDAFTELNSYINDAIMGNVAVNEMQESIFNGIKDKFMSSLSHDPDNGLANFGMGYLSYVRIIYSTKIRDYTIMVNTMLAESGSLSQFVYLYYFLPFGITNFFSTELAAISIGPKITASLPTGPIESFKISEVQNAIDTEVIAPLKAAIAYFDKAAANLGVNGSVTCKISDDDIEIDAADIYLQKALTSIALVGFQLLTTYDLALEDPNHIGTELTLDMTTMMNSEIMMNTLSYNLSSNSDFLDYRAGKHLSDIQSSLIVACTSLSSGMSSLAAETDDQSDDLIPKDNVSIPPEVFGLLDTALENAGITGTIAITNVQSLASILVDLLNGTREFQATAHFEGNPTDLPYSINLGKFFNTESIRFYLPAFDENFQPIGDFPDLSFNGSILKRDGVNFIKPSISEIGMIYFFLFPPFMPVIEEPPMVPPM
jgi:hypothetical protein